MRGTAPREPGSRARLFLPLAAAAFIISGPVQADEFFLLRDETRSPVVSIYRCRAMAA
jgi:hypothetical protein